MCDFLVDEETSDFVPDEEVDPIWEHPLWDNYDSIVKYFHSPIKKALKKLGMQKSKEEFQDLVDGVVEKFLTDLIEDQQVAEDADDDIVEESTEEEDDIEDSDEFSE